MSASAPVEADEFDSLMAACGPFETAPHIAVACSGGADSMALTLLLARWAAEQGGRITALIVDHGLRANSSAEAECTAGRLAAHGLATVRLSRDDASLRGNMHAAARELRYRLMGGWCRRAGVVHLALGHHGDDQAATMLARLARGSGVDGLAAMAPVQEVEWGRLIRPLLSVPSIRLRATLAAARQAHVEDPSNRDMRFQRTRLRSLLQEMDDRGPARLVATARRLGRARAALEASTCRVLARHATLRSEGYALVCAAMFSREPAEFALRGLGRLLACIGARPHPLREAPLERLFTALAADEPVAVTLAGCRVLRRERSVLICREPAAATDDVPAQGSVDWDGRFRIEVANGAGCHIRRLGRSGWAQIAADDPDLRTNPVPSAVRPSLPAFWRAGSVLCVPHLGYVAGCGADLPQVRNIYFRPMRPLAPAPFAIEAARPIL